jgi:hypothetical protein
MRLRIFSFDGETFMLPFRELVQYPDNGGAAPEL